MQAPVTSLFRPASALTLLCTPLFAAAATATGVTGQARGQIFAAPAQFSAVSPGFGVVRTLLALALVLALVFAAAALMRRLRLLSGVTAPNLEVLSQISLGARERAVLLRVGRQQLLIGVAPGNVRLLHTLPDATQEAPAAAAGLGPPMPPAPSPPNFRDLLRRSLGR
jgi:flagellar protein FliO/FliZ